jgi:hypothetical protein
MGKRADLDRPAGRLSVALDNDGEIRLTFGTQTAFLDAESARDLSSMLLSLADEADDILGNEAVTDPLTGERSERTDTEYVADRADVWHAARGLLVSGGYIPPDPEDVISLARFLAGDGL